MKPEKDKARNYELSNVGQAHISLVRKLFTLEFGFVSIAVNSNNLGCHQKLSEGLTIKMFCPNRFSSKYMNKSLKEIILLCVQGVTLSKDHVISNLFHQGRFFPLMPFVFTLYMYAAIGWSRMMFQHVKGLLGLVYLFAVSRTINSGMLYNISL